LITIGSGERLRQENLLPLKEFGQVVLENHMISGGMDTMVKKL
jgi:hypothetical protein